VKHIYLAISAAALSFFTYAQQHGMTFLPLSDSVAQHSSSQRTSGGSSRISHK
jgi:hypothetical protein